MTAVTTAVQKESETVERKDGLLAAAKAALWVHGLAALWESKKAAWMVS